jgi:outer membrane protein OmpA-like peptidoglycan-associated protein
MRRHQLLGAVGCVVLAAWLSPGAVGQSTAPPAAPPPKPIAFQEAVLKAANDLFSKANLEGSPSKITLVIDPLIDGVTGAQSIATQSMERRITELVKESYPRFEVTRFSAAAIGQSPVVLIGTFTAINNAGVADGERDAYRICLALADLGSKKIISKGVARALPESIDPTPVAFFKDSPVFVKDTATTSYIKSCQGTRLGDAMDAAYADRILAAALINDAMEAYNRKKYKEALDLYRSASRTPGGDQLRVLNGLYLANWKLNKREAAAEAFGQAVDFGLKGERLAVKFLFRPGSTLFVADRQEAGQYAVWLSQIAQRSAKADTCLEIVGHTSATGIAAMNDRLSMLRAGYVMDMLDEAQKGVHRRMIATGVGSRELIVGTGKDDASDALDRRVEIKTIKC